MLFVAAAIVAAVPLMPERWISPSDYPIEALRKNHAGQVYYRLTISTTGRPIACEVEKSSGFEELDNLTCHLLMKRAHFDPARDENGSAIMAAVSRRFSWWLPDVPRPTPGYYYDLALALNRLPDGVESPAHLDIAFLVNSAGATSQCVPVVSAWLPDTKVAKRVADTLGKVGCAQLYRLQARPAIAEDGAKARSVQMARVVFVTDPN